MEKKYYPELYINKDRNPYMYEIHTWIRKQSPNGTWYDILLRMECEKQYSFEDFLLQFINEAYKIILFYILKDENNFGTVEKSEIQISEKERLIIGSTPE